MKKFYLSLLTALFFAIPALAQQTHYVYVHGYVKNSNNVAIANKAVKVQADSSGCQVTHIRYTNANGFYDDTLTCNTNINLVRTSTENCNGQQLVSVKPVPPSGSVESNFVVCVQNTATCVANFTFNQFAGGGVQFTNTSTASGGTPLTFFWSFGDGSGSTQANPVHTYTSNGVYAVMLVINNGNCADSVIKTVQIGNASAICHAYFSKQVNGNVVNFHSGQSNASDSIVSRFWSFGDGTSQGGNVVAPVHTYPATNGTYNACLVITSASGCRDTVCQTVTINYTPTGCVSNFSFARSNGASAFTYDFNSSASKGVTATDSIVERKWTWGDGTSTTNNNITATHTFPGYGQYQVCLKITSASGCQKTECKMVYIAAPNCDAQFTASVNGNTVAVNSSASAADSNSQIIERIWTWGDGSPHSTGVSATHTYNNNGVYTVCLKIRTSSGCIDSTCKTITINTPTYTCEPRFDFQTSTTNPRTVNFHSGQSTAGTNDSIIHRRWVLSKVGQWMDSIGNVIAPSYTFPDTGRYTVCLYLYTASGCNKAICKDITIGGNTTVPTNCEAVFNYTGLPLTATPGFSVQFNSANSHGANPNDPVIERIWNWGDGSTTAGNSVTPVHTFFAPGTYNVCLVIKSASGCRDTVCKPVVLPMQNQVNCKAVFYYSPIPNTTGTARAIKFNSIYSIRSFGDSIISRKWEFGDSSILTGNVVEPVHQYTQPGTYTVCLTITTANGCVSRECKTVIVTQVPGNCTPHFTTSRIGAKKIAFNSSASWVPVNDTIIERKWNFGDASPILGGNVESPVHDYPRYGVFTASLSIKTARGCYKTFYKMVNVQDSISNPVNDPIKIMSLYPNPVSTNLSTVVWSLHNNVQAEIAVYDVYGAKKWSMNKTLLQGNNITVVPVHALPAGPYFFRVTTMYGVRSMGFYKL